MQSGVIISQLSEPLSDISRARLRNTVRKEISRGHLLHVVDLRPLTQLDVATLSDLIRVRRWLREVGGVLHLIANQPSILKIMTIAGLDRVFGVYPNEDEALEALGALHPVPA